MDSRSLSRQVSEEVLGWRWEGGVWVRPDPKAPGGYYFSGHGEDWHPERNVEHALTALEGTLTLWGWTYNIDRMFDCFVVTVERESGEYGGSDPTFCLAACRAMVRAARRETWAPKEESGGE